jgi:hypothetical protein
MTWPAEDERGCNRLMHCKRLQSVRKAVQRRALLCGRGRRGDRLNILRALPELIHGQRGQLRRFGLHGPMEHAHERRDNLAFRPQPGRPLAAFGAPQRAYRPAMKGFGPIEPAIRIGAAR